ncbi:hypothetical protein [uncultured Serinicoccus sp.]|uniref:hypothetical protein n=1 Tax=uncultured Serinicoccus sp. TaxID=735514 RepID=UPI002637743F|nr:hypothetical protein [uncultured Serinicoccus sp.]
MSTTPESPRSRLVGAWVAVALTPVFVAAGLVIAYALEGWVAPDLTGSQRSLTSDLLGAVVVLVLTAVPAAVCWRWARSVEAAGGSGAALPRRVAAAAVLLVAAFLVVQLVRNGMQGLY